ncbi:MAG TPA: urease accessory protein UreD [Luteolibacter sp.]
MSISLYKEGISGRAIRGHLDLRCECREDGTPFLSRQSFRAPIHLGKGHLDAGALVVQLANPTAGFFDGDRLDLQAEAGAGTHLVLSTPGASRVHTARGMDAAVCSQSLVVESGAFVEWIPEPFIPQAGARYVQSTVIDLENDAGLLFFEWIAPGRVARGEVFAYESLRWELDLRVAGALVARERYELKPVDFSTAALRERFPASHHVTAYVAGVAPDRWPAGALDALLSDHVYLGHGPLPGGVHLVRALCEDGLHARRLIGNLRGILHEAAGKRPPHLGRMLF